MAALILSRVQFEANLSFHILFPTINIALGWDLLFFKTRYTQTGEHRWMDACQGCCSPLPRTVKRMTW